MRRSAPGFLALGTLVTLVVGYTPHQDASWAERTLAAQGIERTGSSCSSFDGEILWANDTYFSEHFECTNSEQCAAGPLPLTNTHATYSDLCLSTWQSH